MALVTTMSCVDHEATTRKSKLACWAEFATILLCSVGDHINHSSSSRLFERGLGAAWGRREELLQANGAKGTDKGEGTSPHRAEG